MGILGWWTAWLSGCVVEVECIEHDNCASDELCWLSHCEPATDRYWHVSMLAAEVDWLHPDGNPWDTDGSPPDVYAEFGIESDACLTSYVPDDFEPVWYEGCDFYVPSDEVFLVNLWDVDAVDDEFVAGFYWEGTVPFTSLARTAGEQAAFVDDLGIASIWLELWPE